MNLPFGLLLFVVMMLVRSIASFEVAILLGIAFVLMGMGEVSDGVDKIRRRQ